MWEEKDVEGLIEDHTMQELKTTRYWLWLYRRYVETYPFRGKGAGLTKNYTVGIGTNRIDIIAPILEE